MSHVTTVGPRLNEFLMLPVTSPTVYSVTQVLVSHNPWTECTVYGVERETM